MFWNDNFDSENPDAPWIEKEHKQKCSKCGMEFKSSPILYSCPDPKCPLFTKVSF